MQIYDPRFTPFERSGFISFHAPIRTVSELRSHNLDRQRGFSLLEVLVAFSIMALALGIVLSIFSSGVNTTIVAEEYTVATQIAEGLMATSGVETPLILGNREGLEEHKYHWQVTVTEVPPLVETEEGVELLEVSVVVRWGDEEDGRRVELNTIKVGPVS